MTLEPNEPAANEPRAAEGEAPQPETPAEAAAAPEAAAPEAANALAPAAGPPPAPQVPTGFAPGSLFQDRPLTPVEARRLDVARIQPKPWQPTDTDLDPASDTGWDQAAGHELIAVRPEDVPVPEYQAAQVAAAQSTTFQPTTTTAAPTNPTGPATAALSWAKAASMPGAIPTAPPLLPPEQPAASPEASAVAANAATATLGATIPGQAPAEVALAPSERRLTRGVRKAREGASAGLRPMMLMGLFLIGIALGWTTFLRNQPVPEPAVQAAAPADNGTTDKVPPQIASLIAALSSDNQTAVQVVVPAQPYRLLAGELAVDGISSILGARALSTYAIGNDTATEILITGVDPQGNAVTFNLVVHMHNGAISDFR